MKRRYRAIGSPTKAQQAHQDAQRAHGCATCVLRGNYRACGHVRIHHRTVGDLHGNKQLGQDATVALGDWCHQGIPLDGYTVAHMRAAFGPSLHHHKRAFLEELQDVLGERSTAALQRWQDEQISKENDQMTRQRFEQARIAGQTARQAGRGRDKCPLYGMGEESQKLREAWYEGWDEADSERKAA